MPISKREFFLKSGAAVASVAAFQTLASCGDASASAPAASSDSNDLTKRIQALEAERIIRMKIALYTRACDRLDLNLAAKLFAPNSTADYGTNPLTGAAIFKGSGQGLMEWLHQVDSQIYAAGGQFQHVAGQSYIAVNGDHAASETYGYAIVISAPTNGTTNVSVSLARYLDAWQFIANDWFIVNRVVTSDGGYTVSTNLPAYPRYNFATDMTDPSYAILGTVSGS
ncbi:nuclear transport factor 2 family protein [Paraburkholderia sp. MM5482-R1]|uniref:nuclear transport factor 2 family protein n=1 Tax=unclassified Paraburkholderia TaxID=2615204 RepID=UPI003D1EA23C